MKLKYLIVSLASIAAMAGCQEADQYTPSIYITEAQSDIATTITVHQTGELVEFTVSSSKPVDKDTHITLQIRPELVQSYNEKLGRTYELFDADMYTFVKKEVTIPAGKNVSDAFVLSIDKVFDPGVFYCLPVSIVSTDGSMPILEPSSTIYIIFRAPVHSKAVYIGTGNKYIVPSFYEQYDADPALKAISEMTLECRVYLDQYTTSDPYISSVMGFEGNMCMRFGDVKIGWDVLQVCMGDYQPAAINNPCNLKTWYHVAAVWSRTSLAIYIDGQFMTETPHQGEMVDITGVWLWNGTGIGFALGAGSNYNSNRPLRGYLAEARMWTRALTGSELANIKDLVIVDPKSEDLLAYWKMNQHVEIETPYVETYSRWTLRNMMEDLTGNGHHAYAAAANPTYMDATW